MDDDLYRLDEQACLDKAGLEAEVKRLRAALSTISTARPVHQFDEIWGYECRWCQAEVPYEGDNYAEPEHGPGCFGIGRPLFVD